MLKNRKYLSGENNPRYGKHLSEEAKQKLSKLNTGDNHPQSIIIYIDSKKFTCMKYAAEYLNINYWVLRNFRLRHKSGDYYKGHKIEWE